MVINNEHFLADFSDGWGFGFPSDMLGDIICQLSLVVQRIILPGILEFIN
jgi:hypothetical protein